MLKQVFILFVCLLSQFSWPQYTVEFASDLVTKTDSEIPNELRGKRAALLKNFRSTIGILTLCEDQSYFYIRPKSIDEVDVLTKFFIASNYWLTDSKEVLKVRHDNQQLIKSTDTKNSWNITNENREIAGYNCLKAVREIKSSFNDVDKKVLTVWFSPDVPIISHMMEAQSIPGLILSYDDGRLSLEAQSIKTEEQCSITIPKYSILTDKEFSENLRAQRKNKS